MFSAETNPVCVRRVGRLGVHGNRVGGMGVPTRDVPGQGASSCPRNSPAWSSVFELNIEAPDKAQSTQCPNEELGNEERYCQ